MRKKVLSEKKKKSVNLSINTEVIDLLDKYIIENNIFNKSKFIEEILIRELKNKNIEL